MIEQYFDDTLTIGFAGQNQMFTELTKGTDVHAPVITPKMSSAAVTQNVVRMVSVQKEALDKFSQSLTEFLQATIDHAQENQNADPEQ